MTVTYSANPRVEWDNDKICWVMTRSFKVRWIGTKYLSGKKPIEFTVPRGFEHDGPSIPRRLQGIVSKFGNQFQPSIAHDYCYEDGVPGMTRKQADQLFLEGMKQLGVPWYRRNVMYLAVRAAGRGLWG